MSARSVALDLVMIFTIVGLVSAPALVVHQAQNNFYQQEQQA